MTPYVKGVRTTLPQKRRRQLRNIDLLVRNRMNLVYHRKQPINGSISDWLFSHLDQLSQFFIHIPFGLFLRTIGGLMETLVPLGPQTRRAVDDWHVERIGTCLFHFGNLFGLVPIVARLSTQRVVFYIPPSRLDIEDIKNCGPQFRDFTVITIERSIPNWKGHVASMIQVLALAIEIVAGKQDPKLAASIFFQKMAEKITEPLGPNIFAMCELLAVEPDKYATSMLDAIDQFIDAKN